MKVIPKRNFLVRQDDVEGGGKKDVYATKGVRTEMTEKEAVKFWGALEIPDADKKKLLQAAKKNGYKRLV
jgi:hypothetical protein